MEDAKTISDEISSNYTDAEKVKKDVMTSGFSWDDREKLFYGIYQGPSTDDREKKSITDHSSGELQSLVIDSACRVMGQMSSGRFSGIDDETIPRVIAANLVYHEYILPNAKSGGDFFTKQRQTNIYSKVYGKMLGFIDYLVTDKYTGPDLILIHPRRFVPQPGKTSIADMDWCFVDTFVTKGWLEYRSKLNPEVWNPLIIAELNPTTADQSSLTSEEKRGNQDKKQIILRNYFTREGDWTLYEATSGKVIFSETDYWPGIPLVEKGTIPVIDRYWDLCDYERGETAQRNIDTLDKKYFKSLDKSIDPTTIIDPENMVMSSVGVDNKFWFAKDSKTNEPRVLENAPQGLVTYQTTRQIMKANLMSLGAQTDTSISTNTDAEFGKTPEALKMQGAREGARDSWDRFTQERFLEECANMMMAVASKRGMGKIKIPGIKAALEKIKLAYPDQDLSEFENGIISGDLLSDLRVRYQVDPGSTAKQDDAGEKIMAFLERIEQNGAIMKDLQETGKKINWAEAIKRVAIDSGIQDWDKIIVSSGNPNSVDGVGDSGGTVTVAPTEQTQEIASHVVTQSSPQAQPQDIPQF